MTLEERLKILRKLAPEVYGRYWKTDICRHLDYGRRTVFNWLEALSEAPLSLIFLLQEYSANRKIYDRVTNSLRKQRGNAKRKP